MAVGRNRKEKGVVYGRKVSVDSRGNEQVVPDFDNPHEVGMSIHSVRSNRAEIKGQLTNEVVVLHVDPDVPDIGPWTCVVFRGRQYDIASPPFYKTGRRRTSHWEAEVRARPPSDLKNVGH
jgi:hypothetical protein